MQTLKLSLKKVTKSISSTLKSRKKWNHIKRSIKTTKARKNRKTEINNKGNKQIIVTNIVVINSTMSIITLNINDLNAPVKEIFRVSKNSTQLNVVCKKVILNIMIPIN